MFKITRAWPRDSALPFRSCDLAGANGSIPRGISRAYGRCGSLRRFAHGILASKGPARVQGRRWRTRGITTHSALQLATRCRCAEAARGSSAAVDDIHAWSGQPSATDLRRAAAQEARPAGERGRHFRNWRRIGPRRVLSWAGDGPLPGPQLVRNAGENGPLRPPSVGFTWHIRRSGAGDGRGFPRNCADLRQCRRAGEGIDEIVPAHLQEAPIVEPVLADEDRLHRRLHVVVDAARAGAPEEGEGPVVASKTISCVSRMGRDVSQGEA